MPDNAQPPRVDFFISYTTSDLDWANWIAWELQQSDYTYIIQSQHFAPSGSFVREMRVGLDRATQLICVLSSEYLKSTYATSELDAFLVQDPDGAKGLVLPIRVSQCAIPAMLKSRVYIDVHAVDGNEARTRLHHGLAASRMLMNQEISARRFEYPIKFPGMKAAKATELLPNSSPSPRSPKKASTVKEKAVAKSGRPLKILFMASRSSVSELGINQQLRQMKHAIKSGKASNSWTLKSDLDITLESFYRVLNKHASDVIHISGKQNGQRIVMDREGMGAGTLSAEALSAFLRSLGHPTRLAVIDTCYSLQCAKSLTTVVDFAIGVKSFIYAHEAILFFDAFYTALANGRTLSKSMDQARAILNGNNIPANRVPVLFKKKGLSVDTLL